MAHIKRFDHVGITVADIDKAAEFFVSLGLEVKGRAFVEGEFLETVCGIPDSRTEVVMLKSADGIRLEVAAALAKPVPRNDDSVAWPGAL